MANPSKGGDAKSPIHDNLSGTAGLPESRD